MSEWKSRTAVITGGGRGFGLAFGRALAAEGAHIGLIDIDADAAEEAARSIRNEGGAAEGLPGDVTDEARMNAVMAQLAARHGGIDLLINNAGISQRSFCVDTDFAVYRQLLEVDVLGQIALTQAVLPVMLERMLGIGASSGAG